jgi:hypothetical protein
MLGDLATEVIAGVARFLARVIVEIVVETMIEGSGRLLLRLLRPRWEPCDAACIVTGLLFWAVLGFAGFRLYGHLFAAT